MTQIVRLRVRGMMADEPFEIESGSIGKSISEGLLTVTGKRASKAQTEILAILPVDALQSIYVDDAR